jgi:MtN3 and saliva related transmembrane protein
VDCKEAFGFIGGLLTTVSMIPQIWRLFMLKRAYEISMIFSLFFTLGIGFWLIYGILYGLMSIIVWNAIAFVLGCGMVYAKFRWGRI